MHFTKEGVLKNSNMAIEMHISKFVNKKYKENIIFSKINLVFEKMFRFKLGSNPNASIGNVHISLLVFIRYFSLKVL